MDSDSDACSDENANTPTDEKVPNCPPKEENTEPNPQRKEEMAVEPELEADLVIQTPEVQVDDVIIVESLPDTNVVM